MPDDIDQLLRAAMKHLDDQVPSEYFEDLPKRTLERLESSSMQTEPSKPNVDPAAPPPSEDSGLHDIRSLARSTKQRLSANRITQPGRSLDDDDLAASSAGWKAVALPEPAKMVSLPELAELPSKAEIKARDKAAKKAAKDAAVAKPAVVEAKPETSKTDLPKPVTPIVPLRTQPAKKGNAGRNIALVGLGLAAAAGISFVVYTQGNSSSDKAAPAVAVNEPQKAPDPTPEPKAKPVVTPVPEKVDVPVPPVEPPPVVAEPAKPEPPPPAPAKNAPAKQVAKKVPAEHTVTIEDKNPKKPEAVEAPKKDKKDSKDDGKKGDPSFDALLKEAGVDDQKKTDDKPKLDKKQLSTADITKVMGGATGRAQACYKGTQGQAQVRLTVAPSGKVTKVSVGGTFAGKPEEACLVSALQGLSFPPWDGGPQSVAYSYLLSE